MRKIEILYYGIGGINNPLFDIHCKMDKNSYLKLIIDGKEIDFLEDEIIGTNYVYKLLNSNKYKEFNGKASLPKDCKNLTLYEINDGKEKIIMKRKVDLLRRIIWGIKFKLSSFFRKLFRIPKAILRAISIMWKRHHFLVPPKLLKQYFKSFFGHVSDDNIFEHFLDPLNQKDYLKWLKDNEIKHVEVDLKYRPLISILVPVYNAPNDVLTECIESVLNQSYDNFELCLADDHSTNKDTINVLKKYENNKKIKVVYRSENGHISKATNSALEVAHGEFIGLLDNDDLLHKEALYEVVKKLNEDKTIDMIYTDEDKIALNGKRYFPHFKPDFSPDTLLSSNYICHFTVLRKSIMDEIRGFRSEYNGSQDYDLFLRFTEKTNKICHIPKILYHWRMIEGSTSSDASSKNYAYIAGKKALEDALKRRGIKGNVNLIGTPQMYDIEYELDDEPMISIVIPTKDKSIVLKRCIDSIYNNTDYKNYEIILIDNNSEEEDTFKLIQFYEKKYNNFHSYRYECEFNYSFLNNEAVKKSKGKYVLLLNNDTEVITKNWLKKMVGYASQKHIGCVGVKLLYPNDTIQHCGVVVGCAGIAAHAYIETGMTQFGYFGRLISAYDWSAVTAACLMIDKDKYNEVNGLDEQLKVAYNDVDFNIKVLNEGYYNVVVPSVMLYHYESLSRGDDLDNNNKQRFISEVKYMVDKWGKNGLHDKFYNDNLSNYYPFYFDKNDEES
ncbi:MAG: glycosyltransferase [Bacilli bacterium]|nr:glycosyltransferase [Bacilli bacterium]